MEKKCTFIFCICILWTLRKEKVNRQAFFVIKITWVCRKEFQSEHFCQISDIFQQSLCRIHIAWSASFLAWEKRHRWKERHWLPLFSRFISIWECLCHESWQWCRAILIHFSSSQTAAQYPCDWRINERELIFLKFSLKHAIYRLCAC